MPFSNGVKYSKIIYMDKTIIEGNPVALATITKSDKPNQVVVAFAKYEQDKVIITDNYMAQTLDDIKINPSVCLVVWDKDWNGLKIIGEAEYFTSGKWMEFVKDIPENKGLPCKGAIVVSVKKIIESK